MTRERYCIGLECQDERQTGQAGKQMGQAEDR